MTPDTHERRRAFCARLKSERERRDTSLEAIADATKVKASLLQAFERGDVSRWPKGIYRRAFFRDYVMAIGLPAGQHVAEFIELFPDSDGDRPAAIELAVPRTNGTSAANGTGAANGSAVEGPFRITLAEGRVLRSSHTGTAEVGARAVFERLAVAAADAAVVLLVALVVSRWAGLWPAVGFVALAYYSVCTIVLGRSLASEIAVRGHRTSLAAIPLEGFRTAFRQVRARASGLWRTAVHAFVRPSAVRGPSVPLARAPRSRGLGSHDRSQRRLRREDAADRSADDVSKVLG